MSYKHEPVKTLKGLKKVLSELGGSNVFSDYKDSNHPLPVFKRMISAILDSGKWKITLVPDSEGKVKYIWDAARPWDMRFFLYSMREDAISKMREDGIQKDLYPGDLYDGSEQIFSCGFSSNVVAKLVFSIKKNKPFVWFLIGTEPGINRLIYPED